MRPNGSNAPGRVARLRHKHQAKRPGRNPVVPLRHKHQDTPARRYHCDTTGQTRLGASRDCVTNTGPSARGKNPVVQLPHKHQDTPARRYHCDTTGQTRLGASRDCVTNTGPSARAGTPSCSCVTNTRTRRRVATTATQRVKRASARRAIASQTPGHASASLPLRHNGSNAPRRVARLRHKHQDTPTWRCQCDTKDQPRHGVSRKP